MVGAQFKPVKKRAGQGLDQSKSGRKEDGWHDDPALCEDPIPVVQPADADGEPNGGMFAGGEEEDAGERFFDPTSSRDSEPAAAVADGDEGFADGDWEVGDGGPHYQIQAFGIIAKFIGYAKSHQQLLVGRCIAIAKPTAKKESQSAQRAFQSASARMTKQLH